MLGGREQKKIKEMKNSPGQRKPAILGKSMKETKEKTFYEIPMPELDLRQ